MSPLDYIKEGILNGNWETVCEGYERLTGEALQLPVDSPGEVRQVKDALSEIAKIASSILNVPGEETSVIVSGKGMMKPDSAIKKPNKKKRGRPKGSGKKKANKKTTVTKEGEDSSILLDDNNKTTVKKEAGHTQLITNDPDPAEVEANKVRAARAGKNKLKLDRQATRTYEVECNECNKSFQSTRPKGEMGQKCPTCLSGLKSRFA